MTEPFEAAVVTAAQLVRGDDPVALLLALEVAAGLLVGALDLDVGGAGVDLDPGRLRWAGEPFCSAA